MPIEISRTGWLQLYTEMRSPNGFLTRNFTIKPGGIYKGDKVAIDIQRFGEDVAIAIKKCTGPNLNDFDEWTSKEFTPPAYGEAFPVDVCQLLNRLAGVDPFSAEAVEYSAQLMALMAQGFRLIDDKIARAVELQASQVLQTGKLTLTDKAGATVYTLDYKPKATHFPTVSVPWATVATATPMADLQSLGNVIRADGKISSNQLFFGEAAFTNFIANDEVKSNLDNRRYELGMIAPQFEDSGATFQGHVWVGSYLFQMWTYPDTFTSPSTGLPVPYIDTHKVIMKSDKTRLDMTSAVVPLPLGPDPRVAGLMPPRLSSRADGFDVTPNLWSTPNGKQIFGELESRPLLVPVQIDGFGTLNTGV